MPSPSSASEIDDDPSAENPAMSESAADTPAIMKRDSESGSCKILFVISAVLIRMRGTSPARRRSHSLVVRSHDVADGYSRINRVGHGGFLSRDFRRRLLRGRLPSLLPE